MGEDLDFATIGGPPVRARIVDPVLYDPEGTRQDV
jgi:sarcosine oxidase subunit alpha